MRRRDVANGAALAATVGLLGVRPRGATAEPPPETPTVRLVQFPDICDGSVMDRCCWWWRTYALRLHEGGMIRTAPQKLIAQGTDWRFLAALKKELKG